MPVTKIPKEKLEKLLDSMPAKPGCYIMRGQGGNILYIGKAKILKNRVRSYFQESVNHPRRTRRMVWQVRDIDIIITQTELEALTLEATLIKQHQPYYNVKLKDDKSYPYVKITYGEKFPRVVLARDITRDPDARYYGPYSALTVRRALEIIHDTFQLRECHDDLEKEKRRACLQYQIGRCLGPCIGGCDRDEYMRMISDIEMFLKGDGEKLADRLEKEMAEASREMDFERAADLRDQARAIRDVTAKQLVVLDRYVDQDYIAIALGWGKALATMFFVRGGKLVGKDNFGLIGTTGSENERAMSLYAFLEQYYSRAGVIPQEIYIDNDPGDIKVLEEWLTGLRGGKVRIRVPQKGDKLKILEMVRENAKSELEAIIKKEEDDESRLDDALKEIKKALHLPRRPHWIECYDVSNLGFDNTQHTATVSRVVYIDGKPSKDDYRRYRIRHIESQDDYAMMQEAITRRLKEFSEEPGEAGKIGLMLLDGGKGHLGSIWKLLHIAGFDDKISLAALAKREEEIFIPGRESPISFPESSPARRLLIEIRDEAHRFANRYRVVLERKRLEDNILNRIPGVGPKRKEMLLRHFGSVKKLSKATVEQIAEIDGIGEELAKTILEGLERDGEK
ncbi:MAG: excinuclease ABC subunit UvrC [bacterium]|nr:excinuclease ABC subunit UvrC [bacterium]